MMIRTLSLVCFSLLASVAQGRQLIWLDRPLDIDIAADAETQLVLPSPVRVRVPAEYAGEMTVESYGRNVLIRTAPKAKLSDVRLVLQELATGQVILVDVSVSAQASSDPVEIVRPVAPESSESAPATGDARIAMIRFAAREFYAPMRLRGGLNATRQSVSLEDVALYADNALVARPLASWSAQRLYVTAVQLRNTTTSDIDLDPARMRGRFELAAFHSTRLRAAGEPRDRTLVFLVSTQPFAEVFREH